MKRTRKILAGLAGAAAVALALTGCVAQSPEAEGGGGGGTLRVGMTVAPSTLDPGAFCTVQDASLLKSTYVQLLKNGEQEGPEGTTQVDASVVEPYFASEFEVSEDGTYYTFHLNEGWQFPSGEPMDAAAVKYSLDRVNAINGCPAAMINDLYLEPRLIETVEALDDYTVGIRLTRPDGDFPLAMSTSAASIVDPTVVEENGGVVADTPNEWMSSNWAGSGPFALESYEPGVRATLVRNETFGGEPAASERIEVEWIKSDSSMLMQLQEGGLDVALGLSKQSAVSLEDDPELSVISTSSTLNMQLLTPMDTEPWTDVKVREAVTHAIPYEDIVENVLMGYGDLYYGPIQPVMSGFAEEYSAPREYDPELAKQLIEESGLETPVDVTLDIISGDAAQESIATIVQSSLKEIGINVKVNAMSESAWGEAVYGMTSQAALRLDGPAVFSPGYYLQYDENCDSPHNTGRVCIPENRELLDTARSTADSDKANESFARLTENWVEASPKTILYLDQEVVVMKPGMQYHADPIALDMSAWAK